MAEHIYELDKIGNQSGNIRAFRLLCSQVASTSRIGEHCKFMTEATSAMKESNVAFERPMSLQFLEKTGEAVHVKPVAQPQM